MRDDLARSDSSSRNGIAKNQIQAGQTDNSVFFEQMLLNCVDTAHEWSQQRFSHFQE